MQCNFCKRIYDCANESRPGVTSAVLTPSQALAYLDRSLARDPRIAVVGIAGPGDPFATPDRTLETLRLTRRRCPELLLCVASNGLNVSPYVAELADLRVSHVTLTVNAVEPAIGARIYAWIRDGRWLRRGAAGAELLWQRQADAIGRLKRLGVTVKVNTIVIPGVNDRHVAEVARTVAALGVDISNCVPLYPVTGTPFESIEPPAHDEIVGIRKEVERFLPVMAHCTRCRADAVGLLGEPVPVEAELAMLGAAAEPEPADAKRPCVAVATREGVLVNQHLGEAERLVIYRATGDGYELIETRPAPSPGGGRDRWLALAESLRDCRAILVASAGDSPRSVLADQGIRMVFMEGLIEEGLDAVYRGAPIRAPLRKEHRCGSGCGGSGLGCM